MSLVTDAMVSDVSALVPGGVETNVSLATISRWAIGGPADFLIRPETPSQVKKLRKYFHQNDIHHIVIGLTSNLLFADEGLRVPCIQIGSRLGEIRVNENVVTAQAGAWVPGFSRKMQQAGLAGAEHVCGIPGTMGGLICMNGGSLRQGIGSSVLQVTSISESGEVIIRDQAECGFSYRSSVFQSVGEAIVEAKLRLKKAPDPAQVRREMLNILSSRRAKFPQKLPNCGSVFKSNPAMYEQHGTPGAIIESLGFKGYRVGGAMIPNLHANFIVNAGGANASDVTSIIKSVKVAAEENCGVVLDVETYYISSLGNVEAL